MFSFLWRRTAFHSGYLPAESGHEVYFHEYGNPKGSPLLLFHGGPGSKSRVGHAELFDFRKHRIILFDQRGCGLSRPTGSCQNNTLPDLLKDARRLLDYLGIEQTALYGSSWGSTVALVFAQTYPHLISKLVLAKTFLARATDLDWINAQIARAYPDIMAEIMAEVPAGKNLRAHYADLMRSPDRAAQIRATQLYGCYERMIGSLAPQFPVEPPTDDHLAAFRLYMHYDSMNYGLQENQILDNISNLSHIPTLIVHNRLDLVCPAEQSYLLHKALPNSKLLIVPDRGHTSPKLNVAIRKAARDFL